MLNDGSQQWYEFVGNGSHDPLGCGIVVWGCPRDEMHVDDDNYFLLRHLTWSRLYQDFGDAVLEGMSEPVDGRSKLVLRAQVTVTAHGEP